MSEWERNQSQISSRNFNSNASNSNITKKLEWKRGREKKQNQMEYVKTLTRKIFEETSRYYAQKKVPNEWCAHSRKKERKKNAYNRYCCSRQHNTAECVCWIRTLKALSTVVYIRRIGTYMHMKWNGFSVRYAYVSTYWNVKTTKTTLASRRTNFNVS